MKTTFQRSQVGGLRSRQSELLEHPIEHRLGDKGRCCDFNANRFTAPAEIHHHTWLVIQQQ